MRILISIFLLATFSIVGCSTTPKTVKQEVCELKANTIEAEKEAVACAHKNSILKIRSCYENELKTDSNFTTKSVNKFLWNKDGKVKNLKTTFSNPKTSKSLKACIANMYKEMELPKHNKSKGITVNYPISLNKINDAGIDAFTGESEDAYE